MSKAANELRVDVDLSVGSFVVERRSRQWFAQVVGADGYLWSMGAFRTRREALDCIDQYGTAAARNAHD